MIEIVCPNCGSEEVFTGGQRLAKPYIWQCAECNTYYDNATGEEVDPDTYTKVVKCPNCSNDEVYPLVMPWNTDAVCCIQCDVYFDVNNGKRVHPPQDKQPTIEERGKEFFYMCTEEWCTMLTRYSRDIQRRMIASHIEHIRSRVLIHVLRQYLAKQFKVYGEDRTGFEANLEKLEVQHVWFTDKSLTRREIRPGNPPGEDQRPWWLRKAELQIDIAQVPQHIWAQLMPGGEFDQIIADQAEYIAAGDSNTQNLPFDWKAEKSIITM